MARLHLIRHGQASFGKADYDQLSERGYTQSRVLGEWLQDKHVPTALYQGAMKRHRQTLEAMSAGFGHPLPAATTLEGFNEFDHRAVIEALRPEWAEQGVMASELAQHPKPARAFQKVFSDAVQRWISGEYDDDYPETWNRFRERVLTALSAAMADTDGDLWVVTSGGPISVVMQSLLGLDDHRALSLNDVIANTSVTQLLFSGNRRSLAVFNNYAHLEQASPELITYR
ncbi:phosphoglycerate kinase [Tamilnaduibacter salinus]|uniref:Phosphoglycerate kinase n=1 Tax=Tamilnaduibacter salinus TaxID=1484056 RepID=A0A2A2I5Y6_9GAMM|nr:histidine phosphatase family protein [Tamilnaduibacter salinus]PAV27149.1 phosphoglycerate kinase [Tamilnaduibacter salinus]